MDNRAIGVFDSGLGGLTSVKELIRMFPKEDIIYFGDTARVPYGSHDAETIIKFASQDIRFLLSNNVKAVLIACGTVSSTAIDYLKKLSPVPVVGVVQPAARAASECTENGKVAVLATSATVRSSAYSTEIKKINPSIKTCEVACPLFVPLIENGHTQEDDQLINIVAREYIEKLVSFNADTLILGCTHYPIIRKVITNLLPDVKIIEAGKEAVHTLGQVNEIEFCSNKISPGICRFFVSESEEQFKSIGSIFMENICDMQVEKISIDNY